MNDIYLENKVLDDIFNKKYLETENKLFEKNCLELIVELSEFINETKVFKYWTVKKPNMPDVYEEAADTLLMILYFFNYCNIESVKEVNIEEDDILLLLNDLYNETTKLMKNCNELVVIRMYSMFMKVIRLMNLDEEELRKSCFMKIEKNKERLNSNY